MNKQEYDAKIKAINEYANKQKVVAAKKYALTNNDISIGEFVCDHIGLILVDKISVGRGYGAEYPECVYYGVEYTKKRQPRKDGARRGAYQSNLITLKGL